MASVLTEVVVDAGDPERLAAFRAEVLRWERTEAYEGVVEIAGPDRSRPTRVG